MQSDTRSEPVDLRRSWPLEVFAAALAVPTITFLAATAIAFTFFILFLIAGAMWPGRFPLQFDNSDSGAAFLISLLVLVWLCSILILSPVLARLARKRLDPRLNRRAIFWTATLAAPCSLFVSIGFWVAQIELSGYLITALGVALFAASAPYLGRPSN